MSKIDKQMSDYPDIDGAPSVDTNDVPGIDENKFEVRFTGFGTKVLNVEFKAIRLDKWEQLQEELKQLRHHRDTTIGLWASDQDYKATINKATHDGYILKYDFADNEQVLVERVIEDIEEEFKKITFQIK